jgi:CubicO group peptidase (beta-lactamase class C family)
MESLCLLVGIFLADTPIDSLDARRDFVTSIVQPAMDAKKGIGIIVGVLEADRSTHFFGFGRTSESSPTPPNENTIFEIGSITKTFTTLILAEMVRKGEVSLDDPIQSYLPAEWKIPKIGDRAVTLLDLATHTSGFPRDAGAILRMATWSKDWEQDPFRQLTDEHIIESLCRVKLRDNFIGKVHYSNFGMGLLGEALARKAKSSYADLVRSIITQPLGMTSTFQVTPDDQRNRQAPGHDAKRLETVHWTFGQLAGCGALRSTASDILLYLAAQSGQKETPLTEAMIATQQERFPTGDGEGRFIGLGWFLSDTLQKTRIAWHNGGTGGYCSSAIFCRDPAVGVIVLSNVSPEVDAGSADRFAAEIIKRLIEEQQAKRASVPSEQASPPHP